MPNENEGYQEKETILEFGRLMMHTLQSEPDGTFTITQTFETSHTNRKHLKITFNIGKRDLGMFGMFLMEAAKGDSKCQNSKYMSMG